MLINVPNATPVEAPLEVLVEAPVVAPSVVPVNADVSMEVEHMGPLPCPSWTLSQAWQLVPRMRRSAILSSTAILVDTLLDPP